MKDIFSPLIKRFLNFFTRSVAPSSLFFVLLYFNDLLFNNSNLFKYIKENIILIKTIDISFIYIILIIVFLSYGFLNQILSQIQDEFLKGNYNFCDNEFVNLRKKVLESQNNNIFSFIEKNDYNLYQILGKKTKINTSYSDYVKSVYSLATAVSLNIIIYSIEFSTTPHWFFNCLIFLSIFIILIISHFISKKRYKARNKKLYINFLIKKNTKR